MTDGDVHHHEEPASREALASFAAVEAAAKIFHAAGDVERLRLLEVLVASERCVSELAAIVGAGMSTVSQRLRVLRSDGLVESRRDGKHVYYRLVDQHIAELVRNALDHAEQPGHRHEPTKSLEQT